VKYGAVFPQTEIGSDPGAVKTYLHAIDDMGFDYMLAYDHVVGANPERDGGWRGPYTHTDMFHEVLTLFAYGAGITENIEFVTGILILPQRQAVLVAKQTAEIDVLSGGRLRLGVAVGWNKVEMQSLGKDFHTRGKRIEEQVTVMRRLWTDDLVTFDGDYHHLDDVGILPRPVQQPIPVWFGGGADVVLRRMARMGDGWMPNSMPLEKAREQVETLHGYLHDAGRSPDDFGIDVRINVRNQPLETWEAFVQGWQSLGMTHLALNTMGAGYTDLDDHLNMLEQFITHFK
jgi:probable F420-dependent oxidoreductase